MGGVRQVLPEHWKTYLYLSQMMSLVNRDQDQRLPNWSMSLMDKDIGDEKAPCWSVSLVDKDWRRETTISF